MAGVGPPPKPPAQRRRRNAVPPTKKLTEPPPEYPPLPGEHMPQTLAWYKTWATSPQASRFTPTDWQRLHMLASLVDLYSAAPAKELMGEIRLNESLLGATEADRLRLRWDVDPTPPPAKKTAPTRRQTTRKERVLKLVQGGQEDTA